MNIIQADQNQLIVEEKNWGLAIFLVTYAIVTVGIVGLIISNVELKSLLLKVLIPLIPALFALLMLYIFLSVNVVIRCTIDRPQELVTIYQKSLLRQQNIERSLSRLEQVEFVTFSHRKSTSYATRLVFKDGEKIFLNVINSFHKKRKQSAAKAIANFLGLTVTEYEHHRFVSNTTKQD